MLMIYHIKQMILHNISYEDVTQLPNASTVSSDPYHISADEV